MPDWKKDKETVIWKRHSVWISLIINIVLIIFTGALAICTYLLYSSSQKSLNLTQESLELTQESLELTRESVKQQGDYYRPFVNIVENSIKELNPDITPKDNIGITYLIKNYGNLPAKDVQSCAEYFSYENPIYRKKFEPDNVIYSIYPNITQYKQDREMQRKFDNKERSYLHIAITYKDVNEKEYYSLSIIL